MLVARGTPSSVILAMAEHLTWPNYTVEQTREDLAKMIDGARRKGFGEPDASCDPVDDVMAVPPKASPLLPMLTVDELLALPDPEWLIVGLLVENSLAVLYGPFRSYKSFVAVELRFFAMEQQCRRVVDGFWKGLPIAVYGFVSDYGRSYMRPLALLATIVILGAVPIRACFSGSISTFIGHGFSGQALGLSFANALAALTIRKDLISPELLNALPGWLKVVAAIQTILGIVLLFLFGLGIRNRFRMK
jgi:hypothetical protein